MNTTTMDKFYDELLKDDNLETIISIRKMLNNLPYYLASRILDKYGSKCNPFDHMWIWTNKDAVFEGATINGIYLNLVNSLESLNDFIVSPDTRNRVVKHFSFDDEKGLFDFIDSILQEMRKLA